MYGKTIKMNKFSKMKLKGHNLIWIYIMLNIFSILLLSFFIMKNINNEKEKMEKVRTEINEGLLK